MATGQKVRAARRQAEKDNRARATAKYIRMSSRKAGLVLDLIRGKSTNEAAAILAYTPREAAREIEKVLQSAVANAEYKLELDRDSLYVAEAYANQGPTMKRFMPRAQGRAFPILKRSCHVTIVVDQAK
ncbi:MAG: 50S ribosomal protein L22 [Christensenellales bacterium]|jgi:large subunit ribosomal protein L22